MLFERLELVNKERERILKSLNWAVDAYCKNELSEEEFSEILKILYDDTTKAREELNQYTE